jgi:hypothetical protein
MPLTHYIIVRRDLPFGQILAQVAHAAGESFALFPSSSVKERPTSQDDREVGGSSPSSGANLQRQLSDAGDRRDWDECDRLEAAYDLSKTVAVVLGARNEQRVNRLAKVLEAARVPHATIIETDGAFAGQTMAVGIMPGQKELLAPFVKDFHMFTALVDP